MKDFKKLKEQIKAKMIKAINENDTEQFAEQYTTLAATVEEEMMAKVDEKVANAVLEAREELNEEILAERGCRRLTSDEKDYYNKVIEAMKSDNPQMALTNVDKTMPQTIIESVLDDLKKEHPLLSKINFQNTTGQTRFIFSDTKLGKAKWGALNTAIVEEVAAGFRAVDVTLLKLTAFLPISKDMLDLGAPWLDQYVRSLLVEYLAAGLEDGIINGDGKDKPIGMLRQCGAGVVVTGGVYPEKSKEAVKDFAMETVGKLVAKLAKDEKGNARDVKDLVLVVNSNDYYSKILPAVRILTTGGFYADVFPVEAEIIPTAAIAEGTAVLGVASNYMLGAGMSKDGKIEYSDDAKFIEDQRVYITKLYANGLPKDNTSFLALDVSGVKAFMWQVETTAKK